MNVFIEIERIKKAVCRRYGVSVREVESKSRERHIVDARHKAIYECRRQTNATLAVIGRSFNCNHSTVIYAVNEVEKNDTSSMELTAKTCNGRTLGLFRQN